MSDKIISSDHPLPAAQREILTALLETIVPRSEDGNMPSAGELDLAGYLAGTAPEFLPALEQTLALLEESFPTLPPTDRYEEVKRFSETHGELFAQLLVHTYAMYYQDARVLEGIGTSAGPPFPRGNSVEPGDLSLLDVVLEKPRGYRKP